MNERIKRLALEAGIAYCSKNSAYDGADQEFSVIPSTQSLKIAQQTDIWCDQNYSGDDHYDLRWEEKFAELLIKECTKVARDEVQYVADWDRADQVAKAITEHFGGK